MKLRALALMSMICGMASSANAQDSLRLGSLQRDAMETDPRTRQLRLQAAQTALRLRNIAVERLPVFSSEGKAQYQSDVVTVPLRLPNGTGVPAPPHDTYDTFVGVQQRLFDPTIGARRAVERAQLEESQARVQTTLYGLRQEVNEAFFTVAVLQERDHEIAMAMTDLEARLRESRVRVREGSALPSDSAMLRVALLQRGQQREEIRANRRAALKVLGELTGKQFSDSAVVAVPELDGRTRQARGALDSVRARPEYAQFARARDRLRAQADVIGSSEKPRVSAFGRAGYGRPGLNLLSDQFDTYWLAGVQVQWAPWNWGTVRREREAVAVQREVVASDEMAFTNAVRRGVERDLANIDRLDRALVTDDEIVALRERIERETRARYDEGVVTAAEYVDRQTDVLEARVARVSHRVERAQACARVLTTLGLEVR